MDTVAVPHSDVHLSRVGLGCWTLGREYWGDDHDDDRAVRTIHAALASGINWVDTAPLYGRGHADTVVRRALKGRVDVLIATKVGVWVDGTSSGHAESLLTAAHVRSDCEASLKRLDRDRIDLLQVHWPCQHHTALDETIATLDALKSEGKVRAWGLCNYGAKAVSMARSFGALSTLQTPISLLRREYEGSLRTECMRSQDDAKVTVLAYETLVRGLLTGRYRSLPRFPDTDQRARDDRFAGRRFAHARSLIDDLARIATKVRTPLPTLAVGWVLSRQGVGAAIVGARKPEQIEQTALAAQLAGRGRLWKVVDKLAALHGGS